MEDGLYFGGAAVCFPLVVAGAQREFLIRRFEGDIVSAGAIGIAFEEIADPIVVVVVFELQQQLEG